MTVISSHKDPEALTLTFVAEFEAPVESVWQMWADPRQLERWWGPPTWPATFTQHELTPGAESRYYMSGPEGEKAPGWWRVKTVDAPDGLTYEDGFSLDDGTPNPDMPVTQVRVSLEPAGDGVTRMTIVTSYESLDQLEQLIAMGMEEGMRQALGQIDALLAAA
ncbi:SRPBCC domain-containing protein [Herbiconiux sp.]|uniref:SRPBCC family protein n=1 Tax=Herbiconiux sp. TaxID=1871186 RepID=UPI0025C2403F|nr:SRPBCC domain-containing protein [Herbiconiux sp.]